LISTRILTKRRMIAQPGHAAAPAGTRHTPPPRRRRRTRGFVQVASATAAERLRLNAFGHAYMLVGAVLAAILVYLVLAAQVTQSSYQIAQLQDQQRQLIAEQDQLRYQEATLHAPAQVAQQAAQGGMQRVAPTSYLTQPPVAIDLTAPIGAPPTDSTPLWEQAVAAFVNKIGVARDAMAATH
jgi:Tfp pilus assembly protein PilN